MTDMWLGGRNFKVIEQRRTRSVNVSSIHLEKVVRAKEIELLNVLDKLQYPKKRTALVGTAGTLSHSQTVLTMLRS